MGFVTGFGKPQLQAKFEVAGFIYYGFFKNWDEAKWGNLYFL